METTGVEPIQPISTGARFSIFRAHWGGVPAIIKKVDTPHDQPLAEQRLRHEFDLLQSLEGAPVPTPLELTRFDGAVAMVMQDAGPTNLSTLAKSTPLSLEMFFPLATQMAEAVREVHARSVIHRDIAPQNFIVDPSRGAVTLVDFESATRIPAYRAHPGVPGRLDGTLEYIAPEQTGRMQRLVDTRADLYSLGAVFYELLTGRPPFVSKDPLELVHAHLAKTPRAPNLVSAAVSPVLSNIVMKLLEKMPESRYQSAEALVADLRTLHRRWASGADPIDFALGLRDVPYGFLSSPKLYGREAEIESLTAIADHITAGRCEVLLVSGSAGVGKTALIEAARSAARFPGEVVVAKGDLLRSDVPYEPVVRAFAELIERLERDAPERLAALKERIEAKAGPTVGVLLDAISGPGQFTEQSEAVSTRELGAVEAQNRFQRVFTHFVQALIEELGPMVLFVDDLQWVDGATLRLLRTIVLEPDTKSLLIVGAFRDDDVDADSSLVQWVHSLAPLSDRLTRIELEPLRFDDLLHFLSDALHEPLEKVRALCEVTQRTTDGNPLLVRQFLNQLHQDQLLTFDERKARWAWNIERIERVASTSSVQGLLGRVIETLSPEGQQILMTASCIGRSFELAVLAKVLDTPVEVVSRHLWVALRRGLIEPTSEASRCLWLNEKPVELTGAATPTFRFTHDRVQETLYQRLGEDESSRQHGLIGRWLEEARQETLSGPLVCTIADHLNRAGRFANASPEHMANLNARAGREARKEGALISAHRYFMGGLRQLPDRAFEGSTHALWFELTRDAAEAAGLTGEGKLSERMVEEALALTDDTLEQAALCATSALVHVFAGAHAKAIQRALDGLALLGVKLSRQTTAAEVTAAKARVRELLGVRSLRSILESKLVEDPGERMKLQLLSTLSSSWFVDPHLFQVGACRAVELTLASGAAPESSVAFSYYAIALAMGGEIAEAQRFGRLAIDLARRMQARAEEGRTLLAFGGHVSPWKNHLSESIPMLERSHALGLETGDLEFAAYALGNLVFVREALGVELDEILRQSELALAFYRRVHHNPGVPYLVPFAQMARCLGGRTEEGSTFSDPTFDEAHFLADAENNALGIALFNILRLKTSYLLGQHDSAWRFAQRSLETAPTLRTLFVRVDHSYYAALTSAWLMRVDEAHRHLEDLKRWAQHSPANVAHKRDLVAAEIARIEGRPAEALRLYHHAIEGAERGSFFHDQALAHELCGRFHGARHENRLAKLHLVAAVDGYSAWGASAKVRLLMREFSSALSASIARPLKTPALPESLDYLSMLKVTEAVTEELDLDRLMLKLAKATGEAANAERTLVFLDGARVEQHVEVVAGGPAVLNRRELSQAAVATSVVEEVFRTQQPVVLGDAYRESRFLEDPYVQNHEVRSVFALPLSRGQRPVGVLYFENNLMSDAFSPARIQLLRHLSSQLTIAVENARLYRDLHALAEQLAVSERRLKEAQKVAHVGSFEWDVRSGALTWSDELQRIYGFEPGTFAGTFEAFMGRVPPAELAATRKIIFEAYGKSSPFVYDHRIVRTDGEVRVLHSRGDVIGDGEGKTLRMVGTCWDVTEQTALFSRLESAAARWEATVDATAEGILVTDLDGRVSSVSQRYLMLWGIDQVAPLPMNHRRLLEPAFAQLEDEAGFVRRLDEIYRRADEPSFDTLFFKDGRVYERYSTPQRVSGAITGRVWSLRDVTEREKTLHRAVFLADATRLLVSLDVEQALEAVGQLATREMGDGCAIDLLRDGEPRRVSAASHDRTRPMVADLHPGVLRGNSVTYRADEAVHLGVPITVKGQVVGAITFRARPSHHYGAGDNELARELARRASLSIENAQLFRQAQDALRSRDEFLAIAAHEIRGPIHAMHLAIQSIRQGTVGTQALPKMLDIVERQDRRLAQFIDELLDLGRFRAGRLQLDISKVNLAEVVRDVVVRLGPEASRSGSTLTVTARGEIIGEWDRSRLDQVVTNLLSNAIKFGLGKRIEITADTFGSKARVVVRDHGLGFGTDVSARLFKPFERGVSVRHYGGLGLGLHIVKTIVEALGGTIVAESEPGQGATFTVELPLSNQGLEHAHSSG